MAQYKTVPWDSLEHTEIARLCYLRYERGVDQPDEAEIENDWRSTREALKLALDSLTAKQREIVILIAVRGMTEVEAAKKLSLNQSTVSRQYVAAIQKMRVILDNRCGDVSGSDCVIR